MSGPWEKYRPPSSGSSQGPWNRYQSQQPQQVEGVGRIPSQLGQGFNEGLATVAGAPVSTMNWIMGRAGLPVSDEPFLGQNYLRNRFTDAGFISEGDAPRSAAERIVRRVGEEVAYAAPMAGLTGRAAQSTRAADAVRNARTLPSALAAPAVQQAARTPAAYAGAELAASGASGVGAGVAREVAPGNAVAEMAGQMATPAVLFGAAAAARGAFRRYGQRAAAAAQGAVDDAARAGTTLTAGQLATRSADDVTPAGMVEAAARTTPGGNVVLPQVYSRQQGEVARRVDDIAGSVTNMRSPEGAGQSLRQGIGASVDQFRADAESLYNRVDGLIPASTPAPMSNARRVAQEVLGEAVGEGLDDTRVQRIARTIAEDRPRTYADLSRTRTRVGRLIGDRELISSKPELDRLYGALTDDIADVAAEAQPGALQALNEASDFYRTNRRTIDDYIEPFARGQRDTLPEATFAEFERAARRGPTAIRELRNRLVMAEGGQQRWDDAVGVVLQRLGRARASDQGAEGAEFSVETFLTNWNNLRQNGGLDELFTGTSRASMRQDLDAIARTAERMRGNFGNLRNPSGSGGAAVTAGTGLFAVQQLATGNLPGASALLGALGASSGTGALMSRPWFVRWLAQTTPEPAERLPSALSRLAATAALAGDEAERYQAARYIMDVQRSMPNSQKTERMAQ